MRSKALEKFRASESAEKVTFTVKYFPYQLYPDFSKSGEDKYEWYVISKVRWLFSVLIIMRRVSFTVCFVRYKKTKYNDSEEQMRKYVTVMSAHGEAVGIHFKFGGMIANTMDAHRLIQHYQEEMGPETANKIVDCECQCTYISTSPSLTRIPLPHLKPQAPF